MTAVRWALNFEGWQPTEEEWEAALALVGQEERERIGRFKRPTLHAGTLVGRHNPDAKSALVGRLFILLAAARVLPEVPLRDLRFGRTPERKPYLIVPSGHAHHDVGRFNFNVSHAGEWVVMASETAHLVGADVMKIELRGRDPSIERFFHDMRSCFTPAEWRYIREEGLPERERLDRFFRHWTLKEAYIKAVGIGLGFDLQRAEFTCRDVDEAQKETGEHTKGGVCATASIRIDGAERGEWQFELEYLDGDHIVAVARGPFAQALDSFKACIGAADAEENSEQPKPYVPWRVWTFAELMRCIEERRQDASQ